MIAVREVGVEDISLLIEWRERVLREVFRIPADRDISELMESNRGYYQEEIPKGGHVACVAYDGDEAVGCGGVCIQREMPSPDNPSGVCGYLMNIYTLPSRRGRGVGSAVVSHLIDVARERGALKIYLEATDEGRELYLDEGFGDMRGMMKLKG